MGGKLLSFGGDPLSVKVGRTGSERQLVGQTFGATVYVKFAGLLNLHFVLDRAKGRLGLKR